MAGESLIRQNTLLVEVSKRIRVDEEGASQSFAPETNCSNLCVALCVVYMMFTDNCIMNATSL